MNINRVWAVVLRHLYNFRRNLDRIVDALYWPSLDVVIWGLTLSALEKQGQASFIYVVMTIFGTLLWFVMWRGQGEITVNFLEELWSENLANLFASPLKISEWMVGMGIIGLIKVTITMIFTGILAFALYSVNLLNLGIWLVPFSISLLLFSWAFGFFTAGLFLRHGTNVQTMAWAGAFVLMPFSGVFYPLSTLPIWVQRVGAILPTSYVFEGMRQIVQTDVNPVDKMIVSFGLNAVYLTLSIAFFWWSFQVARKNGLAHLK